MNERRRFAVDFAWQKRALCRVLNMEMGLGACTQHTHTLTQLIYSLVLCFK